MIVPGKSIFIKVLQSDPAAASSRFFECVSVEITPSFVQLVPTLEHANEKNQEPEALGML